MSFYDYIKPELLILVPVLNIIGILVSKSKIKNKMIPLFLGAFSIAMSLIYVLSSVAITNALDFFNALFTAITQGVLIAGTSVYFDQIIKQKNKSE